MITVEDYFLGKGYPSLGNIRYIVPQLKVKRMDQSTFKLSYQAYPEEAYLTFFGTNIVGFYIYYEREVEIYEEDKREFKKGIQKVYISRETSTDDIDDFYKILEEIDFFLKNGISKIPFLRKWPGEISELS